MAEPLLEVQNLAKHFRAPGGLWQKHAGAVRAVDRVSFSIEEGTTFAVVGESGCGKTTLAKLILLLERPTHGLIRFRGREVHQLRGNSLQDYKRSVQAVFQDPYSSLNPRMRVLDIVGEPLQTHEGLRGSGLRSRVYELLQAVGLHPTACSSSIPA